MKVLLVEGEDQMRSLLSLMLARSGYEVLVSSDPGSAFAILSAHKPDVILIDIRVPPEPGLKLIRDVRALTTCADVPLIVLSGDGECLAAAQKAGSAAILRRPADYRRIPATIEGVLLGRAGSVGW